MKQKWHQSILLGLLDWEDIINKETTMKKLTGTKQVVMR